MKGNKNKESEIQKLRDREREKKTIVPIRENKEVKERIIKEREKERKEHMEQ